MPGTQDTSYTARLPLPDDLERGAANTLKCPMYRDGALVAPASEGSTVSIFDASRSTIVDAAAVTVTGDVATYSYTPSADRDLEEGWLVEWSLAMPDGLTHTVRNDAALVRRRLLCPITDADLFRVYKSIDGDQASSVTSQTTLQDYIDEAWVQINQMLWDAGRRPALIVGSHALRTPCLHLTLALFFGDQETRAHEVFAAKAEHHRIAFEKAWSKVTLRYDEDDDNQHHDGRRKAATATVWLGSPSRGPNGRGRW